MKSPNFSTRELAPTNQQLKLNQNRTEMSQEQAAGPSRAFQPEPQVLCTPDRSPEKRPGPPPRLKPGHKLVKDSLSADLLRQVGVTLYKSKRHFEAMIKFNDALCFAPAGTEQMARAYANRSAIYMDCRRYKKCLKNIEMARANGYPADEMYKLDDRETRCRDLMKPKDLFSGPFDFFKLTYAPNPKVPFFSKCLEMSDDGEFGPHLITNFNLKSGDFIAITDGALKFIDPLARLHRCSWCVGDNLLDLYPCPGCPQAM